MKIRSFRALDAWKAAMDLACTAYKVAGQLPAVERFELASQVRDRPCRCRPTSPKVMPVAFEIVTAIM